MKKILSIILLTMLSTTAYAEKKATIEDAYRDMKVYGDAIKAATTNATPEQLEYDWNTYVNPSQSASNKKTITRFSVNNGTTRLQSSDTHTCVVGQVGGYYGRGLKGLEVDVYQQSGYWYLKALHNSGGSDNWATATCWNN